MTPLPPPIFQVGHLERLPLGTAYPGIVAHVGRLMTKLPGRPELVIDYTGVGRPVFDMFVYSGISPVGVVITSGAIETRHGMTWSASKLNLVSRLQAYQNSVSNRDNLLAKSRLADEAQTEPI